MMVWPLNIKAETRQLPASKHGSTKKEFISLLMNMLSHVKPVNAQKACDKAYLVSYPHYLF